MAYASFREGSPLEAFSHLAGRIVRQWRRQGQGCDPGGDLFALVERPNRGPNHEVETREAPDVR